MYVYVYVYIQGRFLGATKNTGSFKLFFFLTRLFDGPLSSYESFSIDLHIYLFTLSFGHVG